MTEWLHFHFSLLCIGEGNGNPLHCSCLENPRDGVAQSRTQLKWLSSSINENVIYDGMGMRLQWPHLCPFPKISSVQSLSHVWLFVTPWTAACRASLSITNTWSLLKLLFIESVMPSNHLILCHPLLLLPSVFPSIGVFSNESVLCITWPKYWSFSFSINPTKEYSGLISFRMDWLDLLAVQGTLKSLLQQHSSKALILWQSPFFIVQLLHLYMATGKTKTLTRWTFVSKVMSLPFNMLNRMVIHFLPRRSVL